MPTPHKTPDQRPNIILITTDQQRTDTIAAWGHKHVATPNLDRLAREGVSFSHALCPGATCISSRAAKIPSHKSGKQG